MAEGKEKKPKASSALTKLVPNAIRTTIDGQDIVVAADRFENDALNMVVAAQMRSLVQEQLKKYKDQGATLTPKELKELTEAARNVAEFSTEVYKEATALTDSKPSEKKAEQQAESLDNLDFNKITTPIEVKTTETK